MTYDVIVALAVLGVIGQVLIGILLLAGLLWLVGVRGPLAAIRSAMWGYELWLAFLVAAIGTSGSLFFSEVAHFLPCELCWFQRIAMYPLAIITLLAAPAADHRVARYLLPLPVIGGAVAIYHLFVENSVVPQSQACRLSVPGGCTTKWINMFGYITIPTLALTGFLLLAAVLLAAAFASDGDALEEPTIRGSAEAPPAG